MQDRTYLVFEGTYKRTTELLNKYNSAYEDMRLESQVVSNGFLINTISHKEKVEKVIEDSLSYISAKSGLLEYLHVNFDESAQISVSICLDQLDHLSDALLEEGQNEVLVQVETIDTVLKEINRTELTDNDKANIDLFNKCKCLVDNFLLVRGN